jgi:hypothetical protein
MYLMPIHHHLLSIQIQLVGIRQQVKDGVLAAVAIVVVITSLNV